jgi:hypothetical protein
MRIRNPAFLLPAGPGHEAGGEDEQHGANEGRLHRRDIHREHRRRTRRQGILSTTLPFYLNIGIV